MSEGGPGAGGPVRPSSTPDGAPGVDGRPDRTIRLLSRAWESLGPSPTGRTLLRLGRVEALGRRWARARVVERSRAFPDDVTVLIGVRNRADHRIVNALRSVGGQVYPRGRVSALVVDYGSDAADARRLARICAHLGARIVRVDAAPIWSRSRCLNVGLRRVKTKFVMTSDADIVLSSGYLADAVATLDDHPCSVVCAPMLDLPEAAAAGLQELARGEGPLDVDAMRVGCEPRKGMELHPSAGVTFTGYHHAIQGYDEFYEGWGREDDDLMSRLMALGISMQAIPDRSFYLHQWHPKYEGLDADEQSRTLARNTAHLKRSRSIIRNDESWGLAPARELPSPA